MLQKGNLLFFLCAGTWHDNLHARLFGGRKHVDYTEVHTSSELHMLFKKLSPTLQDALLESDTAPLPQVPGGINYY